MASAPRGCQKKTIPGTLYRLAAASHRVVKISQVSQAIRKLGIVSDTQGQLLNVQKAVRSLKSLQMRGGTQVLNPGAIDRPAWPTVALLDFQSLAATSINLE